MDTVKEWQKQWFYITEPRGTTWAAAAEFRSGAPTGLTSWVQKRPDWGSPDEVIALQTRVQSMSTKKVKLVDVIQVMLVRQILPYQSRAGPLWEFDLEKHQNL